MQPAPETNAASESIDDLLCEAEVTRSPPESPDLLFWIGACLGTTLAGGVFGFFLGGFAGFFIGTILAALYSTAMQFSAAILSWALWLTRFRIGFATLAGGLTGVLATILTLPTSIYGSLGTLAAFVGLAGVLGALGAGIVAYWMTFKTYVGRELHAAAKSRKWQFSLGSLFSHFAVICVLLALWTLAVRAVLDAQQASRIEQDEATRQLKGSPV
jgi:MFS family permease